MLQFGLAKLTRLLKEKPGYMHGRDPGRIVSASTYFTNIGDLDQFGFVNAIIEQESVAWWRWPRKARYLLVADCDGRAQMLATCNMLKHDNINYALVTSSIDRYWVISDWVATFTEVIAKLRSTPGVDRAFIELCAAQSQLPLRGYARDGHMPRFSGGEELSEPARTWYDEFESLFSHPAIKRRHKAETLQAILSKGDEAMLEAAADPDFTL